MVVDFFIKTHIKVFIEKHHAESCTKKMSVGRDDNRVFISTRNKFQCLFSPSQNIKIIFLIRMMPSRIVFVFIDRTHDGENFWITLRSATNNGWSQNFLEKWRFDERNICNFCNSFS